jgi:uncharacterized SAM-binding protein YcdF (DUF218 family)
LFLLSKLVWIVGQPLSLAFLFIGFGFVALLLGWRRMALAGSVAAIVVLFVTLFTSSGSYMVGTLEDRFPRPTSDPQDLRCMIVLGGGFESEVTTARGGYELNAAGDRFVEALRLAQKFPQAMIIVSGGDGSISGRYEGDAVISRRFFSAFGIDKNRVLEEPTSRTTFENAVNTRVLLAEKGLSGCLLITSGFHMPRSVGIFRKLDIDVVPWPVDYRSEGRGELGLDLSQPSQNAQLVSTAVREWMGMVGYYLAGRTSTLYPGPS